MCCALSDPGVVVRFHRALGLRDGGLERGGERMPVRVGVEGDELREACEGVFGDVCLFVGKPPLYFKPSDTFAIPKDCVAEATVTCAVQVGRDRKTTMFDLYCYYYFLIWYVS